MVKNEGHDWQLNVINDSELVVLVNASIWVYWNLIHISFMHNQSLKENSLFFSVQWNETD